MERMRKLRKEVKNLYSIGSTLKRLMLGPWKRGSRGKSIIKCFGLRIMERVKQNDFKIP